MERSSRRFGGWMVFGLLLASPSTVGAAVVSSVEGRPTLETGVLSGTMAGTVEEAARRYVMSRAPELGLPAGSTLGPAKVLSTRFGAAVRFRQRMSNLDVPDADVIVTFDRFKRVVQVNSSLFPFETTEAIWAFTDAEALKKASDAVHLSVRGADRAPLGAAKRTWFKDGKTLRAGYLAHVVTADARKNLYVGVDGATGKVLWQRDHTLHADTANVYPRSPGGKDAGIGKTPTTQTVLPHLPQGRTGGFLQGERVVSVNCCPNNNCDAALPAKRITGEVNVSNGQTVPYDSAVCFQYNGASNLGQKTDYLYTPVDPPTSARPAQSEPADSDLFAQVQAYYQVNQIYDFVRDLSTSGQTSIPGQALDPFLMRDVASGSRSVVATNVLVPNMNELLKNLQEIQVAKNTTLDRTDNAAFMPREPMDGLGFLNYTDPLQKVDSLVIYQGNDADFAYDASVLWHEFTHGVIHSTANIDFNGVTLDDFSANNEGGALHEGIADYFAAAHGNDSRIGEYVAARTAGLSSGGNALIRNIDNTARCPNILWGEVHQDSIHVSGALWEARTKLFSGNDAGHTFDAAVYAALVTLTPTANFNQFAEAVLASAERAFPGGPNAALRELMKRRGVLDCQKVLDFRGDAQDNLIFSVSSPLQAGLAETTPLPGPYQYRLTADVDRKVLEFAAQLDGSYDEGTKADYHAAVLVKLGGPTSFVVTGSSLENDADAYAVMKRNGNRVTAKVELDVPAGTQVYVTVAAGGSGSLFIRPKLKLTDAVETAPEAIIESRTDESEGCGCQGTTGTVLGLSLLPLAIASLRKRRTLS